MNYDELKKLYPNKDIKLVSNNYIKQYLKLGFKILEEFIENKETYYFITEL